MTDNGYNEARTIAQTLLRRTLDGATPLLNREDIERAVHRTLGLMDGIAIDPEHLIADLERSFQTLIGAERILTSDEEAYTPWLPNRKAAIDWAHWRRYEQFLREQGWAERTLLKLGDTTDRALGLLTAPDRPGIWDRRGMVVGHVQSGKTAHYTGLIAKAADAGYKLIIVLTGFHKSLRSQTQIRLEEGFLGYDKSGIADQGGAVKVVGVGFIDATVRPGTVTTRADDGDFKRQVAKNLALAPDQKPILLVVKKNGSVLKNILEWLSSVANARDEHGKPYMQGVPLLVIDDEADIGSIDTTSGAFDADGQPDPDHDPTVLNKRIRKLLRLFEQRAYVGYTATPFANIFIHERAHTASLGEDLFPRSFILSLPTPSNFVGPSKIFGREDANGNFLPGLPIIRHVTDHAASLDLEETHGWMPPRHKKDHAPAYEGVACLPPSLRHAVRCFILSAAARTARGQEMAHNSMLVHVTRFTHVQDQVVEQLKEELGSIRRQLRYDQGLLRLELKGIWEEDYIPTNTVVAEADCPPVPWEDVDQRLEGVIESIEVREINGLAGEVLDYVANREKGLNVIAVGGDKLSRGLTLEGLTVSYFLRASRMYDTLMQMGRWFGYRPGYLDLCRLFSTPDLIDWFGHIAVASEELREDFNRMVASGGTPRGFGHRVRCHPQLMVTSRVKMRHGQNIQVTFAGDISETVNFRRDPATVERNWQAGQRLIQRIEASGASPRVGTASNARCWSGVEPDLVLDFLSSYQEHEASQKCIPKLMGEYIRKEVGVGRLTDWCVQLCSGSVRDLEGTFGSVSVPLINRGWHDNGKPIERKSLIDEGQFRVRRVVNPTDEQAGLDDTQLENALTYTVEEWVQDPKDRNRPDRPSGPSLRMVRAETQGLLLLYPMDGSTEDKVEPNNIGGRFLGFAISFPFVETDLASKVSYQVNNVYWEQEFGERSPLVEVE